MSIFNSSNPDYEATMDYIKNLTKFGINLGLGRIQALLKRLGNPENDLHIIHIGGTNGKGSTTAILQSILQQAGYRVGMFISPHLHDYRERITINGEMISPDDIVKSIQLMKPHLEAMVQEGVEHPTEFEVSTAMALTYFSEQKPDFVLLEVGLGGEIDSTNVVIPLISVITSIGMDHMDYLGDTLEKITEVKAGIIKTGIPVVTAVNQTEALQVIKTHAQDKKAELIIVGQSVQCVINSSTQQSFDYHGLNHVYKALELSLYGQHQFINASTAIAVGELLTNHYGYDIPESAVRNGLQRVTWPGRLELLQERPKILLDGAHNAEGMQSLAQSLQHYDKGVFQRKKLVLCLGMLQDKEIEKALQFIVPLADIIVITKPDSPRAGNWENVAVLVRKVAESKQVHTVADPVRAIERCLEMLDEDDMLCVTGSLYMIAPVRAYLLERIRL